MEDLLKDTLTPVSLTIKDQIRLALAMVMIKAKPSSLTMENFIYQFRQEIREKQKNDKIQIDPYTSIDKVDDLGQMIGMMMEEIRHLKSLDTPRRNLIGVQQYPKQGERRLQVKAGKEGEKPYRVDSDSLERIGKRSRSEGADSKTPEEDLEISRRKEKRCRSV